MFALNDISFNDNDSKMHLSYHSNLSALSYDSGEDHVYVNGVDFTIYQRGSDRNSWTAESSTTISADNFYSVYVDGAVNSYNDASHSYNYNMTSQLSTTTGVILYGSTTDHCLTLTPACCIIRLPLGAAGYTAKIGFTDGRIVKEGSINVSTGTITPTGYLTGISNPSPGVYAGQFLNMKMDADNN